MTFQSLDSSFRDPSGFMFEENGLFKRAITAAGRVNYESLMSSGLYGDLTNRGWLIPHEEERRDADESIYKVITPSQLDFVSYPYEWSFEQLKDAALLTLQVQAAAMRYGMSLKDASAFNVQFRGPRPIFIDTLSFELNRSRTWIAYRQFCEHFLGPLLMMSEVAADWNRILQTYLDGVPLELASESLPLHTFWRPGALLHIHLHARMARRQVRPSRPGVLESGGIPSDRKLGLVDSLSCTVSNLRLKATEGRWTRYYAEASHYSTKAGEHKRRAVLKVIQMVRPSRVLDLGGNNGSYARLVTSLGIPCVCLDLDPLCVNENYIFSKRSEDAYMLPLLMDITNPSPSLGFESNERLSLFERPKPDLVMALGILHHLRIRGNVPLRRLARFFERLSGRLLVEFVPREDPKVQQLLAGREGGYEDLTPSGFWSAFSEKFRPEWSEQIPDTGRSLHLMHRRT